MTPEQIDRVFGCGRLQMVTGKHVEVFREAAVAGTRRRYTKRFLHTLEADFGQWTEREWRILARLIGHGIACVPDVVQYDRGAAGGTQLVQTYDAGVTVDQWATILPVMRNGRTLHHVFEDCAHWWALAHHCLHALQAIHELSVVHLDIKGDNVCIPFGPPGFDPHGADLHIFPRFGELALIDFAFALVSRESLPAALPIGWQTDYDYQSPRLLHALEAGRNGDLQPTRQLDWRCDMYSLAAMLKRYLPDDEVVNDPAQAGGWSATHVQAAKELILALREAHDGEATLRQPHARLLELTITRLADADMRTSLAAGWALARDANVTPVATSPATPVTRLAPPLRVIVTPRVTIEPRERPVVVRRRPPLPLAPLPLSLPQQPLQSQPKPHSQPQPQSQRTRRGRLLAAAALALVVTGVLAMATPDLIDRRTTIGAFGRTMLNAALASIERVRGRAQPPAAATAEAEPQASPTDTAKAGRVDTPTSRADAAGGGRGDAANTGQADKPPPNRDAAQSAPRGALASKADTDDAAQTDVSAAKASPSEVAPNAAPASETDAGDAAQQTADASASPSTATGPGPAKGGEPTPPWRVSKTRSAKATTPTAPATPALAPPPVAVAARPKTSSGAKFAEGPSRPAKIASAPPRPNVAAGAKIPPTIASATAPKRIRFFDDDPTRSATTTVALAPITTRGTLNSEKAAPPLGPVVEAAAPVAAAVAKPAPVPAASAAVTMPAQDSLSTPPPAAPPAQIAPAPTPGLQTAPAAREPRDLLSLLRDLTSRRDRGKAPIEDRTVASVPVPRPSAAPSVPPKAPDGMGSENRAPAAAAAAPNPSGLRSPSAAPGDNARPPVTVPSATDAPAFALTPPDDARTSVARPPAPQSRPIPRELAPRVAPPGALAARDTYGSEADATDLAAQARRTLAESVPYSAARAQGEVARVLRVAANAGHPAQEHNIVEAVRRGWPNYQIATSAANIWPASARQLHEEARRAYAGQRNVGQAFDLQLRAFGANPHDAEVAGNLAFLYLKTNPMQPETARQLSLHAIALRAAQMRPGLVDDWSTLAVASALTGREMDATNALYVAVALSPDLDRNCKVMLGTVDRYGDVMSGPVQAMMSRIRQYGRDRESPYCVWPPINSRTARAY